MKIALLVPSWPPGFAPNGIVTYASYIVPALRRLGHEVYVLTYDKEVGDKDPYTIDLRPYLADRRLRDRIFWKIAPATASFNEASSAIACAIRELLQKYELDIFETEESFGWSSVISQMKLLPVVVRLHGPWFLTGRFNDPGDVVPMFKGRERLEGRGIKCAHFVTANCSETLQAVKKYYRCNLKNSRVIPTPIDAAPEAATWNLKNSNQDSLLFVGRFDKLKGGDLILRAFAELAAQYPKLKLTFIGPDKGIKQADGSVLLFEQFVRANLPDSCRAQIDFRGQMRHADVMSSRTKHFATLIAAQYDTMGYMLLEPMSLACPIVATAVGGIPEVIKHERNGLLIPSQDVNAMVHACRRFLEDRELAARMGRQAWLDCGEYYAPEVVAKQTVATYEQAIDVFKSSSRRRSLTLG